MAFPTTSILDSGSGTNSNPINGWTADIFGKGNTALQRTSNQITGSSSSQMNDGWFGSTNYGPDSEVYWTMNTTPGDFKTIGGFLRIQGPGASTADAYDIEYLHVNAGGSSVTINRVDNGVDTQLGATISQDMAAGDSLGLSITGSTLQAYYKASAGSWGTLSTTRTDSTYSSAGKIGLEIELSTARVTNFGGGTIVSSTFPVPHLPPPSAVYRM